MSLLDGVIPDIVADLIPEFTDNDLILTTTAQRYDFATDTREAVSTKEYKLRGSPPFPYKANQINGTSILASDLQVILPARDLPVEPRVRDTLSFKNPFTSQFQVFNIVSVERYKSGDLNAAYLIQCRK